MSAFEWSTTAANNDDADANVNWLEGQDASTVNNSSRAMMAAIASVAQGLGGALTTGGTGAAYTLTLADVPTAYTASMLFLVKFNAASTSTTPTLNVNSLGGKTIKTWGGNALPSAGYIPINGYGFVKYDGTAFRLLMPSMTGTWTPTLVPATLGNWSLASVTAYGQYAIEGSTVTVTFDWTGTPTFTTSAGSLKIQTLPFTSAAGSVEGWSGTLTHISSGFTWPTSRTMVSVEVTPGSTDIYLRAHGSAVNSSTFSTTTIASGASIRVAGSITYQI